MTRVTAKPECSCCGENLYHPWSSVNHRTVVAHTVTNLLVAALAPLLDTDVDATDDHDNERDAQTSSNDDDDQ